MNYTELMNRIEELKNRKGRGSISADETFSLLMELAEKTKAVDINAGSLTVRRVYISVAAMNADSNPLDQETGKPLKFGQLVCVCNAGDLTQADNGKIYRYNKPGWELLRQVGDMVQFAKTEEVNNKLLQVESEIVNADISTVGANVINPNFVIYGFYINWTNGSLAQNHEYNATSFVRIKKDTEYYSNAEHIALYDKNNNFIRGIKMNPLIKTFTTDSNTYYARVSFRNTIIPGLYEGNQIPVISRFYQTVKQESRLDKYPYDSDFPFSKESINKGLPGFIIDAVFNIPYENQYKYSFGILRKNEAILYKQINNTIPEANNITAIATFRFLKQENSKYWYAENTTGYVLADFDSLNFDNTDAIYNNWYTDGAGLSPRLFKGINSQRINLLKDDLLLFKEKVNILSENIGNIEHAVSDIGYPQISNGFEFARESECVWGNETSTFCGWAFIIGPVQNFNGIQLRIKNRSPELMTKVRIRLKSRGYDGSVIFDKIYTVRLDAGDTKIFAFNLESVINNTTKELIWLEYICDQQCSNYLIPAGNYPYRDRTLYSPVRYTTKTDLEGGFSISTSDYVSWFNVGLIKYLLTEEQIQDISERLGGSLVGKKVNLSLPDKIYAIVGDTLQLFYRGIIQAVDPYMYDILVTCQKGNEYPRYIQYTPKAGDVGVTSLTITVKDNDRNIMGTKRCDLVTRNIIKSPSNTLNVACFGDSLTSSGTWCSEANRRLTGTGGTPAGNALNNISFIGSKKNGTTGYFGVGGWTWASYTTAGRPAFRFQVSGITSLTVGSVYSNNGNQYTIMEVNVTAGTGNILCGVENTSKTPEASGVLSKVDGNGDSFVTYQSYSADSQNPLWDYLNDRMTFIPYANTNAGGRIDIVYTLLSWNEQTSGRTDFTGVISRVEKFADTLHAEFPEAKLKILGVQVPSVRGGMGANYGATGMGYADEYGMVVTALNQNTAYQEFANRPGYSDFVEFVNVSSQFDTEFNMPHTQQAVNTRNMNETERIDTNGLHPTNDGYFQIADVVYRNFIANFCQ